MEDSESNYIRSLHSCCPPELLCNYYFQNFYSSLNASIVNNNRNNHHSYLTYLFGIHGNEEKVLETYFTFVLVTFPLFYYIEMNVNSASVHEACNC